MRSKQTNVFVRRNISMDRRMHQDFDLHRNNQVPFGRIQGVSDAILASGKESRIEELKESTKYSDLLVKSDKQLLHQQLKPLILILRVLGSFPVEISTSG
jgi:hypothetical protein